MLLVLNNFIHTSTGNDQHRKPALCQLYRHTCDPIHHWRWIGVIITTKHVRLTDRRHRRPPSITSVWYRPRGLPSAAAQAPCLLDGLRGLYTFKRFNCSVLFCSVLFISRPRSEGWPHNGLLSLFISVLCHSDWLFFSASPVHVLMLSIQAVRRFPRLSASGIVPCIISFSRQLPCFLMVWP